MDHKPVRILPLVTGLVVLLSSLGCTICPLVPRPPTATPTLPPATPTPRPTPTPSPVPTLEVSAGMELYTSKVAGIRIPYPQGWVYYEEAEGVIFSDSQNALDAMDLTTSPLLIVFAGTPERIGDSFNGATSAQELLENGVEGLCQDECTVGTSEPRMFGETPGLMAEISWLDPATETRIQGYVISAFSDDVASIGVGLSSADNWPTYGPSLEAMLRGLELFPPELPEPIARGAISPGSTVEGTLPVGGIEVWSFEARAGEYVTILLEAADPAALDTYLELYDEQGQTGEGYPIASDDDSGGETDAMIADFLIEATGTYYIHATSYSGHGDYRLTLTVSTAPSGGGELEQGKEVRGTLPGNGSHTWTFIGKEGDEVSMAMTVVEGEMDAYLELYSPAGELLISDDDSGGGLDALIEYYLLPVSGEYRVIASEVAGEPGSYRLKLERAQLQIKGRLSYGQPAQATLEAGARHHWQFEGQQGDIVTISMIPTGEWWDTYLALFAPSGKLLTSDDDSGVESSSAIIEFALPATGVYRVLARGYGASDAGAYRIIVEQVELKIQGRLAYGQTITATLEANTRHHWQFEGKEGDHVTISMTTLKGEIDPYLELFAPGGELLTTDDDSGGESNAEIYYLLPLTGVYRIVARSYNPAGTGTYQLSLK
ncbi:MAG: PPC domain-containing protein [Anaerolineae bacterium]|nr:PPC domain-containing protein [Anaerolineae bacterium]